MPLYAVETVRSLVADGRLERDGDAYRPVGELGTLAIPDTLRSLIASRLDALDPADRSLVADASVLGQAFVVTGLAAVSGQTAEALEPRLKGLVRRELFDVEIDPRSPERGQYHFVQSLIREVAYGTLAKRERRTRHLAAARYFEALGEDELAGALASHYLAAHEASAEGAEADAVAIQARLALSGAAERAATLGSLDQAVAYLNQAIAITADPGERAALFLRAARSANDAALHEQAEHLIRAAIDLARSNGDLQTTGEAEALHGDILIDWGRTSEAAEVLEAALAAFPESGTGEVRATLLASLSRAYMRTGRPAQAVATADLALDLAEHLDLDRIIAETFNNKGSALGYLGRRREALVLLKASIEAAHAGGFVAAETRAMSNFGAQSEDVRTSAEMYRAATELARRVGNRNMANWALVASRYGNLMLAEGWDEVIEESQDEHADDQDSPQDVMRRLSVLTFFLAPRGDSLEALIDRMAELVDQVSDKAAPAILHFARSQQALRAGDYEQAIDEGLLAAEDSALRRIYLSTSMRPALWGRDLARGREIASLLDADPATGIDVTASRAAAHAGIAALEGRTDEAVNGFRQAFAGFRTMGATYLLASYQLDMVVVLGPDHPAAREAAAEARPILERIKARFWLEILDAALASGPVPTAAPPLAPKPDPRPLEAPRA